MIVPEEFCGKTIVPKLVHGVVVSRQSVDIGLIVAQPVEMPYTSVIALTFLYCVRLVIHATIAENACPILNADMFV